MTNDRIQKVTENHLRRDAYLYIRQAVPGNTESTQRQYQLRERVVALGWPLERIHVVDNDQGQSGASKNRKGFQKLVAEVGMDHAGIVVALELSRLTRNSSDWYRLLEVCTLTDTLILVESGIYDPNDSSDRLSLGLRAMMPRCFGPTFVS